MKEAFELLPKGFPPISTVQKYFWRWSDEGLLRTISNTLVMVGLVVHAADIQDCDGALAILKSILKRWPWLRHDFADGGYAGPKLRSALQEVGEFTLEIVKQSYATKGFEVLPLRWVVERTFAWLGRCRRLAKDVDRTIASAEAWTIVAHNPTNATFIRWRKCLCF